MVYVAPSGSGREFRPVDVGEKFPQLAGVKKRVVATPAELKEKILIFEADLDDYAVELVKYALAGVLAEKTGKRTVQGYFSYADEKSNRICFSFFPEGEDGPVCAKPAWTLTANRLKSRGIAVVPKGTASFRSIL